MVLDELYHAIDGLSVEDFDALAAYIQQRREQRRLMQYTPEERILRIEAGFAELRRGLTETELMTLANAMTSDTRQKHDELDWRD